MKFNESLQSNKNLLTSCNRNCNDVALIDAVESIKTPYFYQVLPQNLFNCFCVETCTTMTRLDMRGNTVYQKIKLANVLNYLLNLLNSIVSLTNYRRLLVDMDIPALLIFLKKHQDIAYINLASNNISDSGFRNLLDHVLVR